MARRVAFWGPIIAGFLGLILTVNASLGSDWVGAGVLLMASVFAFGVVGYIYLRR